MDGGEGHKKYRAWAHTQLPTRTTNPAFSKLTSCNELQRTGLRQLTQDKSVKITKKNSRVAFSLNFLLNPEDCPPGRGVREIDVGYDNADKNYGAVVSSKELFKEQ